MKRILKSLTLSALLLAAGCKGPDPVDPRDAYIGSWHINVNENCGAAGTSSFTDDITISKGPESDKIVIHIESDQVTAIFANNSFTITTQNLDADTRVNGSGTFSGKAMTATLHVTDLDDGIECTFSISGTKN